ncbi:MAG: ribonuclease III [Chthoniobacteraceae bacterium]
MNPLEARLRYKFRNALLLAEALTHPSLGHETQRHHFDNQRLEFLGDAVLQLVFTEYLFEQFPDASEGVLTKARARLVSREGLRALAESLELGRFVMLGRGEEAAGGRQRPSVLSDAYEALIGAIYLDSDYITARRVVLHSSREQLDEIRQDESEKNPKGELQEILQSLSTIAMSYAITDQAGPEHDKRFNAEVTWRGVLLGRGDGRSKKEAEVAAARDALARKAWVEKLAKTLLEQPVNKSVKLADNAG